MAQWVKNLTDIHEDVRLLPGLAQGVKDLVLLWLWYRLVVTTLIRPLAWESPYAAGAAIKRKTNGEVEKPEVQLLSQAHQSHNYLQNNHQRKQLEPLRKDLLQVKIKGRTTTRWAGRVES